MVYQLLNNFKKLWSVRWLFLPLFRSGWFRQPQSGHFKSNIRLFNNSYHRRKIDDSSRNFVRKNSFTQRMLWIRQRYKVSWVEASSTSWVWRQRFLPSVFPLTIFPLTFFSLLQFWQLSKRFWHPEMAEISRVQRKKLNDYHI